MGLLDDALLFNPWVSNKKDTSEDIPTDVREDLRKRREEWLNGRASKHNITDNG